MLSGRSSVLRLLASAAAAAALAVAPPPAQAKQARVGGKVSITIPGFSPDTGQSLASGRVKAKAGCGGLRVLRFAYFGADGMPTSQELTSVVSFPNGKFLVALTQPSGGSAPHTLRIFVEPRKTTFRGRSVTCKPIRGAAPVPPSPQPPTI